MKKIEAIIKPFKTRRSERSPAGSGGARHHGHRSQGFGRQKGHTELYRGAEYVVISCPR